MKSSPGESPLPNQNHLYPTPLDAPALHSTAQPLSPGPPAAPSKHRIARHDLVQRVQEPRTGPRGHGPAQLPQRLVGDNHQHVPRPGVLFLLTRLQTPLCRRAHIRGPRTRRFLARRARDAECGRRTGTRDWSHCGASGARSKSGRSGQFGLEQRLFAARRYAYCPAWIQPPTARPTTTRRSPGIGGVRGRRAALLIPLTTASQRLSLREPSVPRRRSTGERTSARGRNVPAAHTRSR